MLAKQIRNALITAFVLSLALASLSYAAGRQPEQLEVVARAYQSAANVASFTR